MTVPLFRRLLGARMDDLPPLLRRAHDAIEPRRWRGTAQVRRSRNPLARILCCIMKLPRSGTDIPVSVVFEPHGDGERWTRTFAGRSYHGDFTERDGELIERMGPAENRFRVTVEDGTLRFDLVGFRFLGVPLPEWLAPRCPAREEEDRERFVFDVPVSLAALGPVIRYSGRLESSMSDAHPIVLFDAECVLCSANAQFILTHDRARRFRLASMQGATGAALFRENGIDPTAPDTILMIDGDMVLRDSDAVIAIYAGLGWPWRLAGLARAIPRTLRDPLYRWIARHRYRIFGRRDTCWVPRPEDADRVL